MLPSLSADALKFDGFGLPLWLGLPVSSPAFAALVAASLEGRASSPGEPTRDRGPAQNLDMHSQTHRHNAKMTMQGLSLCEARLQLGGACVRALTISAGLTQDLPQTLGHAHATTFELHQRVFLQ